MGNGRHLTRRRSTISSFLSLCALVDPLDQDEGDVASSRRRVWQALQDPRSDPVPPEPDGATGVRRSHLQGTSQLLLEVQIQRCILAATFCDWLSDLWHLRERTRQITEEAAWTV